MSCERLRGTVKESLDDFLYCFQAGLLGAEPGLVEESAADFPASHDSLLLEAIHDSQNGRIRAGA